jgi:hypothetical protein
MASVDDNAGMASVPTIASYQTPLLLKLDHRLAPFPSITPQECPSDSATVLSSLNALERASLSETFSWPAVTLKPQAPLPLLTP